MTDRLVAGDEVVLFGGGGHGLAVADVVRRLGARIVAVVDPVATAPMGVEVLRDDAAGCAHARVHGLTAVLGVGANRARLAVVRGVLDAGVRCPAVVAVTATVAEDAWLGAGTVVMEHGHVGPLAELGGACVVNTGAIVEHECRLDDAVHCAPGSVLSGSVTCGTAVLIGVGASVIQLIDIGSGAVVGAGAVVVRDVPADATVMGAPAHRRRVIVEAT